jgi:hypothetical protein
MVVKHVNRKRQTFYLHETKTERIEHVMDSDPLSAVRQALARLGEAVG